MDGVPEYLTALEDLLVKEFRTCQSLHTLTREERQAVSGGDVDALLCLVEQKEALLDELGNLEDQRRALTQDLAQGVGLKKTSPSWIDVLRQVEPGVSGRLANLQEGILAMLASVRDLTHGNRALAASAMERADAVQAFLLNLYQPTVGYQPPGQPPAHASLVAWDVDQRA